MIKLLMCAMNRRYFIIGSLWLLVSNVQSDGFDAEQLMADHAMKLFSDACLEYYPDRQTFNDWVTYQQFDLVSNQVAKGMALSPDADVYSVDKSGVRYLLIAEPTNICSVFAKKMDLVKAGRAFQLLQKQAIDAGYEEEFSSEEQQLTDAILNTFHYRYTHNEQHVYTISATMTESTAGAFQLALSVSHEHVEP